MIRLDGASARYGRAQVLWNISLQLEPGEVLAIVGSNGAGKTTLVSAIAGAVPLADGRLKLDGSDITRLGPEDRLKLGIALCPEGRRIFASLTVEENLRVGATVTSRGDGRSRRALISERMIEAYEVFPILYERRGNKGGHLSGGQQQMLAIARALMSRPTVLILDEPSLGLAPKIIHEVYELLDKLRHGGRAIVLAEESAARAFKFADRALVLKRGRVVIEGAAKEVANDPRLAEAYVGIDMDALADETS